MYFLIGDVPGTGYGLRKLLKYGLINSPFPDFIGNRTID